MKKKSEETWFIQERRKNLCITRSRKESNNRKTVLETDTGGEVRNALRLMENEYKGTRPIDSVT